MYSLDDAFAQILPLVRSTVRTYLDNEDDAQDAVQDTLARLLTSLKRLPSSVRRWKGYAYTTARNTAFDHLRMRQRHSQHRDHSVVVNTVLGLFQEGRFKHSLLPDQQLAADGDVYLHKQVIDVLNQLPKLQRHALIMYARGFSYQEIANEQNTSVGTVRSRLHYARKQARQLLARYMQQTA
jgi:RNA polymerase sigma-70 factor, ECF subfamily